MKGIKRMIEQYLSPYKFTSRQEISARTGLNERTVRQRISELKLSKAVIYNSQTKGYRLRKTIEELKLLSLDEIVQEMKLNRHSKNDILSRIDALKKEIAPYEEYNIDLEKEYLRKATEEMNKKRV